MPFKIINRTVIALTAFVVGIIAATAGNTQAPTAESYAEFVGGTIVPPGDLVIDNRKLFCGRRPTVLDDKLDDYGAAFPGFVILNPRLLAGVPTPVKLWIYAHECGHQFRGPDEAAADCFAVQRGRRQGWLTPKGLEQVCTFISPAPSSIMHLAGPQRCQLMRRCYAEKKVY